MNRVSLPSQHPDPVRGRDPRATRLLGPLILVEELGRTKLAESFTECSLVRVDQPANDVGALYDAVIAHIYRAGLMIGTWGEGAGAALMDELSYVTDELDAAIRRIQLAAYEDQCQRDAGRGASGQVPSHVDVDRANRAAKDPDGSESNPVVVLVGDRK